MNNLTKITVYGELGKFIGHDEWEFDIKSVAEGIRTLNLVTKNKFNEYFIKKNKLNAKYRILINGKDFISPYNEINEKNWECINQTELVMKKNNLETIDIVPIIESSSPHTLGIITTILGAVLIVVGVILTIFGFGFVGIPLIVAGLALLGAGVVSLLSRPPPYAFNQNLDNSVSQSYLFNGPTNTVGEGNPAPIGYGTVLVGSNVISAGYKVSEFQTNEGKVKN